MIVLKSKAGLAAGIAGLVAVLLLAQPPSTDIVINSVTMPGSPTVGAAGDVIVSIGGAGTTRVTLTAIFQPGVMLVSSSPAICVSNPVTPTSDASTTITCTQVGLTGVTISVAPAYTGTLNLVAGVIGDQADPDMTSNFRRASVQVGAGTGQTPTPTPAGPTATPTAGAPTATNTPVQTPTPAPPTPTPTPVPPSPTPTRTPGPFVLGPLLFETDCDYSNTSGGLFRDFVNGGNINRAGDNFGGGHGAVNFNNGANTGTNGLTLFDTDPATTTPTVWAGNLSLSADAIQSGTNANKPGLVALFNQGAGQIGLAFVLAESGSTDTIELHRVPQSGDLTASTLFASTNVSGLLADGVWYRMTLDVIGDSATGKFFTHSTPSDPGSAVNPTPAGTVTFTGLSSLGLPSSGQAGMIFDIGANTSKASFTNFQITGTLAASGTDPLPGKLAVVKHVVNDNGGTSSALGFTINVGACSFQGLESPGRVLFLKPGTYTITETGPGGYTQTQSPECTSPLAAGDVKTCTITNDDIGPTATPTPPLGTSTNTPVNTPMNTPTPTPSGPTTFTDNFNRANSTTLGNGWVELAGDLNITSNQLQNAVASGDHVAAQPTQGGATETVDADFTSSSNSLAPSFGLILRCQDCAAAGVAPMNYYKIYRATGGSSLLKISKVVFGTETVLKSYGVSNPTANVAFHLQARVSGNTLIVALDGVDKTPSATDSTFPAGSIGIVIHSGGAPAHKADNFQATVQ